MDAQLVIMLGIKVGEYQRPYLYLSPTNNCRVIGVSRNSGDFTSVSGEWMGGQRLIGSCPAKAQFTGRACPHR